MPETRTCRIYDADKPTAVVREAVLDPISPLETVVCATCEHVQNHSLPDDRCAQCGDVVELGFTLELEYPLGAAELPAYIAVKLCGDCAGWVAHRIVYGGVHADEEANERYIELIDRERDLERSLEVEP